MMLIERQPYEQYKKSKRWSRANEPIWNKSINDKYLHYPDMYIIYTRFSKIFNIPIDNFILTSGCEESLKISLQVLKKYINDKEENNINLKNELVYEYPSWGLSELIMDQFADDNYELKRRDFVINNKEKKITNIINNNMVDYRISYETSLFNGLFYHDSKFIEKENLLNQNYKKENDIYYNLSKVNKESFRIIDEVYHLSCLRNIQTFEKNNIYIGSFSKIFGPGFRLGYIIYDIKFDHLMNYYRPQYISQSGVELIELLLNDLNQYKNIEIFKDFDKALNCCIEKTEHFRTLFDNNPIYYSEYPNYISVDKNSLKKYANIMRLNSYKINKEFKLNNIDMVRLSRPLNFKLQDI